MFLKSRTADPTPAKPEKKVPEVAAVARAGGLLAPDESAEVAPGQMRQGEFLDALRTDVKETLEQELDPITLVLATMRLDGWVASYRYRTPARLEKAVKRHAPDAREAATARDMLPAVRENVRAGIARWRAEGESPALDTGGGSNDGDDRRERKPGFLSTLLGPLLKRRGGDGRKDGGAAVVRGGGAPLDSRVRLRMGRVFGRDLGRVRVHTGRDAERSASGLGARAFTVGDHISFGAGEYKPGTPVGDALLAHELAHVEQQSESRSQARAATRDLESSRPELEQDADRSAMAAVLALWGRGGGLTDLRREAVPRLRSGLRLQGCETKREKEVKNLGKLQYDFLEKRRKKKEDAAKKAAEAEAKRKKLPPPKTTPKVSIGDVLEEDTKKHGWKKHATNKWTDLSKADQAKWKARAKKAWDSVVASVKGTELEKPMKGKKYEFNPEKALKNGWYAWRRGTTFGFGMPWVKNAEANPKNAWPNVAHEMGGHFEYGKTYSSEIMEAAMKHMPATEREKWKTDKELRKQFHATYEYPETEIYSALRERRYSSPPKGIAPKYGGLRPEKNVAKSLKTLKDGLHPDVARAVLKHLWRKIDASSEILTRDKLWFQVEVKSVFGYVP